MGWTSGSYLMDRIIEAVKHFESASSEEKKSFFKDAIAAFEQEDADTLYECLEQDKEFDAAYYEVNPDAREV